MPDVVLYTGDAVEHLRRLPDACVQLCVTSPPYYGLRDYGVEGQIGLEESPRAYVERLLEVFVEVKRVLRDDGLLFVVIGDSYNPDHAQGRRKGWKGEGPAGNSGLHASTEGSRARDFRGPTLGSKAKDLLGIPWMLAFALRDELDFYLRAEIIWHKPNCMPDPTRDRPTRNHEQVFMLSKSARYFLDDLAWKEPATGGPAGNKRREKNQQADRSGFATGVPWDASNPLRNPRTVWTVTNKPFPEAHFATYPEDLIEPIVKAATSEAGSCGACGAPIERIVERRNAEVTQKNLAALDAGGYNDKRHVLPDRPGGFVNGGAITIGWKAPCVCGSPAVPCVVLDPFSGAGTTALVAAKLKRRCIGIELKSDYNEMAVRRLAASGIEVKRA